VRPQGKLALPYVIFAIVHFFKTAFARHSTVDSVLNDLALARFFGTLAVVWMPAPMRPLAEDTVPRAGWRFVLARFQAASFALGKDTLTWFAAFVVRARNWSLAGTQASAITKVCVAPVGPLSEHAIGRGTRRTFIAHLAADSIPLSPHAFVFR
jgi:hypothetical protein